MFGKNVIKLSDMHLVICSEAVVEKIPSKPYEIYLIICLKYYLNTNYRYSIE